MSERPFHDGPLVQLLTPMPLTLVSEIMQAVADVCQRYDLEAFFKEETGLGVIHARPIPVDLGREVGHRRRRGHPAGGPS